MSDHIFLSVIIPSYKEGERIGRTLLEVDKYLKAKEYIAEVLVIVDGSPDNTAEIANNYALRMPYLRVINNPENHGKGYVVRQGLLEAKGQYRLFMDADGSTAITHWDAFYPEFAKGADLVIGDRDLPTSYIQVHQPKHREIMGDMGNLLIRSVLGLWGLEDTQCGFKVLSAEAAQSIARRMVVDRFGFDFELIKLARELGFSVKTMPVRWLNEAGSTVSLTGKNGFTQVLIDLFKTRMRLWSGAYKLSEGRKQGAE